MIQNKLNKGYGKFQKGATMMSVLIFLTLMTIVAVSATRLSIYDVLASSNEQQLAVLSQKTENDLKELTRVVKLFIPLTEQNGAKFSEDSGIYQFPKDPQKPNTTEEIIDTKVNYHCNGFNGKAASIGPSIARCYLYDFKVKRRGNNTNARDSHNRGAAKEQPNPKKNSYL